MKCLSLWQPWATLIAIGAKRIETRSWYTSYRGPLAIHAAKKRDTDSLYLCLDGPFRSALAAGGIEKIGDLPFGTIVCVCDLINCATICGCGMCSDFPPPAEPERSFGNYEIGRYAWKLANIRRFKDPIPLIGHQGLFNIHDPLWDHEVFPPSTKGGTDAAPTPTH